MMDHRRKFLLLWIAASFLWVAGVGTTAVLRPIGPPDSPCWNLRKGTAAADSDFEQCIAEHETTSAIADARRTAVVQRFGLVFGVPPVVLMLGVAGAQAFGWLRARLRRR